MSDNRYTGQLFIREASSSREHTIGKRLVIVAGVIEVDESFPLEGETQYVTIGRETSTAAGDEVVELTLFKRLALTLEDWEKVHPYFKHLKGQSIDGLLLSPIWRT
jgi:hypothetical protein